MDLRVWPTKKRTTTQQKIVNSFGLKNQLESFNILLNGTILVLVFNDTSVYSWFPKSNMFLANINYLF